MVSEATPTKRKEPNETTVEEKEILKVRNKGERKRQGGRQEWREGEII